ncbi:MAG: hypothetical protein MUO23_07680, partial [Anaerolineales bacterium]|nr:hypothetical protein [Anaerolineales bacterium]
AGFEASNALPAWANVFVVAGHGPESTNLHVTLPRLNAFLGGQLTSGERAAFVSEYGVDGVLLESGQAAMPGWSSIGSLGAFELYNERGYVVLAVDP